MVPNANRWTVRRYQVNPDLLPKRFIPTDLAESILFIGKAVRILSRGAAFASETEFIGVENTATEPLFGPRDEKSCMEALIRLKSCPIYHLLTVRDIAIAPPYTAPNQCPLSLFCSTSPWYTRFDECLGASVTLWKASFGHCCLRMRVCHCKFNFAPSGIISCWPAALCLHSCWTRSTAHPPALPFPPLPAAA